MSGKILLTSTTRLSTTLHHFRFPVSPSPEAEAAFAGTGEGMRKIDTERLFETVAEAARELNDSGLFVLSDEDLAQVHPRIAGLTNGDRPRAIEFRATSCMLTVHCVESVVIDQFRKKGLSRAMEGIEQFKRVSSAWRWVLWRMCSKLQRLPQSMLIFPNSLSKCMISFAFHCLHYSDLRPILCLEPSGTIPTGIW